MPVNELELEIQLGAAPPPPEVTEFIAEADRRIDRLFETERNRKVPRFIPSNPLPIYRAIEFVTRNDLPLGRVFCEWGSGFGVVTCLAALLGYRAVGIEIEPELAANSRTLATDVGIDVEIFCTSYLPAGYESYAAVGGEELVLPEDFSDRERAADFEHVPIYEGMAHGTDEIDLFFVYPWPGEQEFMLQLFDAVAAEGAILLVYLEDDELAAYQKLADDGLA